MQLSLSIATDNQFKTLSQWTGPQVTRTTLPLIRLRTSVCAKLMFVVVKIWFDDLLKMPFALIVNIGKINR